MTKIHFHVMILAYAKRGTKVQVPRETKPSTLKSIPNFYSSTYAILVTRLNHMVIYYTQFSVKKSPKLTNLWLIN